MRAQWPKVAEPVLPPCANMFFVRPHRVHAPYGVHSAAGPLVRYIKHFLTWSTERTDLGQIVQLAASPRRLDDGRTVGSAEKMHCKHEV